MGSPIKNDNPANALEKAAIPDDFVPMSIPQQRLTVPEIPGFHLHWFEGTPQRLMQAQRAYYQPVDEDEVKLSNTSLSAETGNTDMGTRVSISAGRDSYTPDGQPLRLYLMKQPQHLWEHSQRLLEARNEQIASALRGGVDPNGSPHDQSNRYVPEHMRKGVENLFTPKNRRP